MSDALTDEKRYEDRYKYYDLFLKQLVVYLGAPTDENLEELRRKAEETDNVDRGYRTSSTDLVLAIRCGWLERLVSLDLDEWADFLEAIKGYESYEQLKRLSPI